MGILENKLEELNSIDENWIEIVDQELKTGNKPSNYELVKRYNQLWDILRKCYKQNPTKTIKTFKLYVGENKGEWLLENIEDSLKVYFSLDFIRQTPIEKAKQVIDYYFNNVIIYYDPQFVNDYSQFDCPDKKQFWNAAKSLGGLTDYYIKQHYTAKAITKDLEMETDMNTELCVYVTKKIEENYHILQLNYVIDFMASKNC